MTLPDGTVALDCNVTAPTVRPAPVIVEVAAACVAPTTLGTVTPPADTTRLIACGRFTLTALVGS